MTNPHGHLPPPPHAATQYHHGPPARKGAFELALNLCINNFGGMLLSLAGGAVAIVLLFASFILTGFFFEEVLRVAQSQLDRIMATGAVLLIGAVFVISLWVVAIQHRRASDLLAGKQPTLGHYLTLRGTGRIMMAYLLSKLVAWVPLLALLAMLLLPGFTADGGTGELYVVGIVVAVIASLLWIPVASYLTFFVTAAATQMSISRAFARSWHLTTQRFGDSFVTFLLVGLIHLAESFSSGLAAVITYPYLSVLMVTKYQELERELAQLPAENFSSGAAGYPRY
ncbi:hypothetical protein WG915_08715 [Corynebacterium sp. H128]|uniref:hypothetical protein n=1 Tax=unclassified Corynebacterium TaxID=2624378 RepID=UPI00309F0E1B